MNINEYKDEARRRIESGKMTPEEWEEITNAILMASENEGLPHFDENVDVDRLARRDNVF